MEQLLEGRQNENVMKLFKFFIPCVVGKKKFKATMSGQIKRDVEICTVSDEAFALLLLENQYDRWTDIFTINQKMTMEVLGSSERRKRKWESDVSPKYTEGGINYSDNRKMSQKGWKESGIVRFNALCALVKEDRTQQPDVILKPLLAWWNERYKSTRTKPDEPVDIVAGTSAYHELWNLNEPEEIHQSELQAEETLDSASV
jgi:hypothetical protein